MRNLTKIMMAVVVLSAAVFMVAAGESKGHYQCAHSFMCPMKVEGAEVTVENTTDGVVVRITSKNKETVQAIQEAAAMMKEHHAVTPAQKRDAKKEVWVCSVGCYEGPKTDDGRCPQCGMNLKKK